MPEELFKSTHLSNPIGRSVNLQTRRNREFLSTLSSCCVSAAARNLAFDLSSPFAFRDYAIKLWHVLVPLDDCRYIVKECEGVAVEAPDGVRDGTYVAIEQMRAGIVVSSQMNLLDARRRELM
jgi:hypothetical protein